MSDVWLWYHWKFLALWSGRSIKIFLTCSTSITALTVNKRPTQPKTLQTCCKLSILPTCCKLSILPACCNSSTNCNQLVNFIRLQQVCEKKNITSKQFNKQKNILWRITSCELKNELKQQLLSYSSYLISRCYSSGYVFSYIVETTCKTPVDNKVLTNNLQVCWQLATDLSSTSCRKPGDRILISACW